jgi:hypothetical protein
MKLGIAIGLIMALVLGDAIALLAVVVLVWSSFACSKNTDEPD